MSARVIRSWKAKPAAGVRTPGLILKFDLRINEERFRGLSLDEMKRRYQKEARRIVDAMSQHLPGGLTDAIFSVFCEKKASLLIVPHEPLADEQ